MKIKAQITQFTLLATALVSFTFMPRLAQGAEEYSFKVHNTTKETIKKLLASEDGKKYGFFDIGSGIKAGEKATLVWDKSTNEGACEHFFKAVYADGEESEPVKFDFCEDDLELEF
ncbi:MAG: hypothetical protein M3Q89_03415 [Verrucomicrobiota bacterium]|nr:hypothetical protein [Verrucomicrobiota bacterium]